MSGDTTVITKDAQVKTNVGTICGIIGATAIAVGATLGTYYSLDAKINEVRQAVEPVKDMKAKTDQLWWEHHTVHAANTSTPKGQP